MRSLGFHLGPQSQSQCDMLAVFVLFLWKLIISRRHPHWEISYLAIQELEQIGMGSFGKIFKGKWNGTTVVVKTIWPPDPQGHV